MDVKRVAVVGAGTMGRGIAHVAALGGYETIMSDVDDKVLNDAMLAINKNMRKGIDLGKLRLEEMENALARLKSAKELGAAASEADLLIEAVPEEIGLKMTLFAQLDKLCPPKCVLATNTSALSITEIASATKRPEKVVGMHFFNPAHIMRLVEIVRGLETSDDTFKAAEEVAKRMGKETVEVNESPGFVTSRINAMIGNEAFYMLQEGVASAHDIDKALKLGLNHPMGPFEMADLVGLDVRLNVLEYLHKRFGEKFRPCPLLIKYVKAGRLGRKSGKGVYIYEAQKK